MLPEIPGYSSIRTERGGADKKGGGLCMLYRSSMTPHHWTPSVEPQIDYVANERQWIIFEQGKEKCAFLNCYMACQTNNDESFIALNEDLFYLLSKEVRELRSRGFIVLCMGDFNSRVGRLPGLS